MSLSFNRISSYKCNQKVIHNSGDSTREMPVKGGNTKKFEFFKSGRDPSFGFPDLPPEKKRCSLQRRIVEMFNGTLVVGPCRCIVSHLILKKLKKSKYPDKEVRIMIRSFKK